VKLAAFDVQAAGCTSTSPGAVLSLEPAVHCVFNSPNQSKSQFQLETYAPAHKTTADAGNKYLALLQKTVLKSRIQSFSTESSDRT